MLGKRIVGPRDAVLIDDPAIDQEGSDPKGYFDDLFDSEAGHIKVKPGQSPTIFRIGPMTAAQLRHAKALPDQGTDRADFMFCCGIHGISNYIVEDAAGAHEVQQPDRKDRPGMGEMASLKWLHDSGLAVRDVEQVAAMVLILSEPRPSSSRP